MATILNLIVEIDKGVVINYYWKNMCFEATCNPNDCRDTSVYDTEGNLVEEERVISIILPFRIVSSVTVLIRMIATRKYI